MALLFLKLADTCYIWHVFEALNYLWYRLSIGQIHFTGFVFLIFYGLCDICNQHKLMLGCAYGKVSVIMLLIPLSFCSISFPSKWKVHSISFPVIVIPILKAGTNCLWHYRKKVTKRIITESDILDRLMRGIIQNQSMSFHKVIQRNKKRH